MGANQAGDTKKNADGFHDMVTGLKSSINKPMIITEFGSGCSP